MDQLAIAKSLCKAAFRVLHAADIGIGLAAPRSAPAVFRPPGWRLSRSAGQNFFSQVMDATAGAKSLVQGHRPGSGPDFRLLLRSSRALDVLKSAKRPLIILGKGRGLRAG